MLTATAVRLVEIKLSACSGGTGNCAVTEHGITQDINAVRQLEFDRTPCWRRMVEDRDVLRRERTVPAGSDVVFLPASGEENLNRPPNSGNPQAGHDFAAGTCTRCHVVLPKQKSPFRFANTPDFRMIANAP